MNIGLLYNPAAASLIEKELRCMDINIFPSSYLNELTAEGFGKYGIQRLRQSILIPDEPNRMSFTDDPDKIEQYVREIANENELIAMDTESCSFSTPFNQWPSRF